MSVGSPPMKSFFIKKGGRTIKNGSFSPPRIHAAGRMFDHVLESLENQTAR